MNIFFLDQDPKKAVKYMTDKHVVKMVLESAQLLSTIHRVVDGEHYIDSSSGRKLQKWRMPDEREEILYKSTHFNHPCTNWLKESVANYIWLYEHFLALSAEYTLRFGKTHASYTKLGGILQLPPVNLPKGELTEPAFAMPEQYITESDVVKSYHDYYVAEKLKTEKDWEIYIAGGGKRNGKL